MMVPEDVRFFKAVIQHQFFIGEKFQCRAIGHDASSV
jgi:hypothetical protein